MKGGFKLFSFLNFFLKMSSSLAFAGFVPTECLLWNQTLVQCTASLGTTLHCLKIIDHNIKFKIIDAYLFARNVMTN